VFDERSRILVLGTFPSVMSRENRYYYGHPQNRFWRVLAAVFDCAVPQTTEEKRAMLLAHGVALWDVVQSCDITGSADSSIRNAVPPICALFFTTVRLSDYRKRKHCGTPVPPLSKTRRDGIITLPSTSPANAVWTLERLTRAWKTALSIVEEI
jgi:hypoxanthine-DNA glycosylase